MIAWLRYLLRGSSPDREPSVAQLTIYRGRS